MLNPEAAKATRPAANGPRIGNERADAHEPFNAHPSVLQVAAAQRGACHVLRFREGVQ